MLRKPICFSRVGRLVATAGIVLTALAGNLPAGVLTTFLNNVRYFPSAGGTVSDTTTGSLTAATADSHSTSFNSNPGNPSTANLFNGLDTITGSPLQMGVRNSVTINQATDSSFDNWLSFAVIGVNETGVTVTGGSGTGYLLPTFRIVGSFNVGNPNLYSSIDTCDGNGSCIAASAAFDTGGSQPQNVNVLYTPSADSTTSFQFGTPFPISYSFDAFIGFLGGGTTANPGGPVVSDFTIQLASIKVVDASGAPIPGAQIHSTFVDLANVPEPGTTALGAAALLLVAASRRRKAS
jgi:hypothetical protein